MQVETDKYKDRAEESFAEVKASNEDINALTKDNEKAEARRMYIEELRNQGKISNEDSSVIKEKIDEFIQENNRTKSEIEEYRKSQLSDGQAGVEGLLYIKSKTVESYPDLSVWIKDYLQNEMGKN